MFNTCACWDILAARDSVGKCSEPVRMPSDQVTLRATVQWVTQRWRPARSAVGTCDGRHDLEQMKQDAMRCLLRYAPAETQHAQHTSVARQQHGSVMPATANTSSMHRRYSPPSPVPESTPSRARPKHPQPPHALLAKHTAPVKPAVDPQMLCHTVPVPTLRIPIMAL